MALQDLTPQLRTRLTRLERLVGLFVSVATLLMLCGLIYYVWRVADRRGWFLQKLPYHTFVRSGAGLSVGDPVKLMGFDVGTVTEITALPVDFYYGNVYVAFRLKEPFYGYLWDDSRARVASRDLLGNRFIEVTKGTNGAPTYLFHAVRDVSAAECPALTDHPDLALGEDVYDRSRTNLVVHRFSKLTTTNVQKIAASGVSTVRLIDYSTASKIPTHIWDDRNARYRPYNRHDPVDRKGYFLPPDEAADIAERIEKVMNTVETALPGVLDLTNQISATLARAAGAAARAESLLAGAQPMLANLTLISGNLTNAKGSLGEWIIPPAVSLQLTQTLASANTAVTNANTLLTNTDAHITELTLSLGLTLENLASITSNLHTQVEANTNMLGGISQLVIDTDDLMQGLKRHWLLRSAFKNKGTNAPAPAAPPRRAVSPKHRDSLRTGLIRNAESTRRRCRNPG